jgi:hypothetical protein
VCTRLGKTIEVVDTPGIFDTNKTEREIHRELIRSLLFATPGFHAIAFVFEIGQFTDELVKTKNLFFKWFGCGVEKYACIILTRTEDEHSVDEYISTDTTEDLQDLIRKCGGRARITPIENKSTFVKRKEDKVKRIIEMVEEIKRANNNTHFTNVAFQLATAYAYNRQSEVISMDSIYILRKAGLHVSDKDCKMLDNILEVNETDDSASGSSTFGEGKRTNRRENRNIDINSVSVTYSSDKGFNDDISIDDTDDQTREDSGPSREDYGTSREDSGTSREDSGTSREDSETSREDSGTSDTDPLDELKDDIKSGRKDETGFFNFLRRAWNFSKKKLKCIIS